MPNVDGALVAGDDCPDVALDCFGFRGVGQLVTFITVGYGDLVPRTAMGRSVAVTLMIGGVGLLAGLLAEFLTESDDTDIDLADSTDASAVRTDDRGLQELLALRAEIAELRPALSRAAPATTERKRRSDPGCDRLDGARCGLKSC